MFWLYQHDLLDNNFMFIGYRGQRINYSDIEVYSEPCQTS